jgi:hypothetical protein
MTLYFASDWNPIICPSCDKEIAKDWCPRCEGNVSEHPPMMTLDEWRALNPEIVAADRARLDAPFVELRRTGTGGWL